MNQPPQNYPSDQRPPDWRRPAGVAQGTWQYINQRSIADHYDDFVADTPLCALDQRIVEQTFPAANQPSQKTTANQTIIDLGCGTGRTSIPLAKRGYDVIGVDLSDSMLRQLVAKAERIPASIDMAVGSVQPLRANLVQLGCLSQNSVDHAVCLFSTLGMIAEKKNRTTMLQHIARIVRPGGRFLLHIHHRWSALHEPGGIPKLARSWWKSLTQSDTDFGDSVYQYRGLDEMFMHRFSQQEITRLLTSCGWKIQHIHRVSLDGSTTVKSLLQTGGFIIVAVNGSNATAETVVDTLHSSRR
ncbi:class I SAM-dependent methyltransferase [Stieleria marina]|uniref:Cypemycin methyltransferase n=1 Tax=Stieleria marina TaxID=1930275 RepID=A0A517P2F1_9BACT|nr:Cypemycin methyltransferase [Planctomycetes bacterium K23_9]